MKTFYNKRQLLAPGLAFLPKRPNKIHEKLRLIIQEKEGGNGSENLHKEMLAVIDKLLEIKSITTTQHKKNSINFKILQIVVKLSQFYEVDRSILKCACNPSLYLHF